MLKKDGQLQLFANSLPSYGHATDDLSHGLRYMPLSELIQKAKVQYNWKHSVKFLGYDDDSDEAIHNWQDRNCPPPNLLVASTVSGHAHLLYALETPVHKYDSARKAPLRYLGAVDVALTKALGADPGYTKLICNNPLSDRWVVFCFRQEPYDLDELASWLDLEPYQDRRKRLPAVGYGRNCTLFERLRLTAYKERRQPSLSEDIFLYHVQSRAMAINATFDKPLPMSEVRSTAKSVGKWTWTHMSPEGFREWQRRNGKRSGAVRAAKALELREQIIQTIQDCPTLTQGEIAALHGITQPAVSMHLREYKRTISDKGLTSGSEGASE